MEIIKQSIIQINKDINEIQLEREA